MMEEELQARLDALAERAAFQEKLLLMLLEMQVELLFQQRGDGIYGTLHRAGEFVAAYAEAQRTGQPVDLEDLMRRLVQTP